jgi:hypothetical protein
MMPARVSFLLPRRSFWRAEQPPADWWRRLPRRQAQGRREEMHGQIFAPPCLGNAHPCQERPLMLPRKDTETTECGGEDGAPAHFLVTDDSPALCPYAACAQSAAGPELRDLSCTSLAKRPQARLKSGLFRCVCVANSTSASARCLKKARAATRRMPVIQLSIASVVGAPFSLSGYTASSSFVATLSASRSGHGPAATRSQVYWLFSELPA